MKKVLVVILFLLSISCTEKGHSITLTPNPTLTFGVSENPSSTPFTATLTQTPLSTIDAVSSQNVISPQIKNICPEKKIVPIDELGLSSSHRLLLLSSTVESYPRQPSKPMSVSSKSPIPTEIFEDELYEYAISPNHNWIYFSRPSAEGDYMMLWVSSLDGKTQWPVIALDDNGYAGYASWISEEEVLIVGSPNKSEISSINPWEYSPFISINPFTLEQRQLAYLARNPEDGLYYYDAVDLRGHPWGMYGKLNRVDFIYDYVNDESFSVFSWLDNVNSFDMQSTKPIWAYDESKFAVTVSRPDGIDLALNLDIQLIKENKQYDDVMERFIFQKLYLPTSVLGIAPIKQWVALQRFDIFNSSEGENWFYILDYDNQVIYDYCLDLQNSVKRAKFSPDGKFIAFSMENFSSSLEHDQHYVIVLNLENGKTYYLKGYVLVGWGI